ncbi:hypothetical protein ACJIZ3_007461 [Penstemon smallii]|uniref:Uncharacterized protein n=1 Tax=Penstemon smallii TaxID=265156 RepID=A0ABD3SAK9_9LAMI
MGISALMNGDKKYNTNLEPLTEIHNSSIRCSQKLPQRGMGIEKLEEFRRNPIINSSDHPIHFLPNPYVGSMDLYPTYFNPRRKHMNQNQNQNQNQLRTDCFEVGPSTYCDDTRLKKRRFNSENLDLRLNTANNLNIVGQYQNQHDVKIVAVHEKGPSREEDNVVIEYQFFPGAEMTYEQQ